MGGLKLPRTYIATPTSKKILSDAKKRQKEGKSVDWNKVFTEVQRTKAKNVEEAIRAINAEKGKKK